MFDGGLTFRQILPRKIPFNIFVTPLLFQIKILRPLSRQEFLKILHFRNTLDLLINEILCLMISRCLIIWIDRFSI